MRIRPNLTVRVLRGRDPGEGPELAGTTAAERVLLVEELTREGWAFGGRPMPQYTRATMPVSLARRAPNG